EYRLGRLCMVFSMFGVVNGVVTRITFPYTTLFRSGADDVDQDGQFAVPLHRLDRGPRARRRAGLGGDDLDRIDLFADAAPAGPRSEEHTSELQSREKLVCRLLLEKKKYLILGCFSL